MKRVMVVALLALATLLPAAGYAESAPKGTLGEYFSTHEAHHLLALCKVELKANSEVQEFYDAAACAGIIAATFNTILQMNYNLVIPDGVTLEMLIDSFLRHVDDVGVNGKPNRLNDASVVCLHAWQKDGFLTKRKVVGVR